MISECREPNEMTDPRPSQTTGQPHSPLRGKTILVTRTAEQAAEFIKLLEQLGATTILFPTIEIVPPRSWEACDRAVAQLGNYDSIVITSSHAANHFFSRVRLGVDGATGVLSEKTVYAVGEKTKAAVEGWNIPVAALPAIYDAKHLAISLSRTDVKDKRFLLPKGNLAGNAIKFALEEHGAIVDEVVVYETVQPSNADTDRIRDKLEKNGIDIISFFSPSRCPRNYWKIRPSR
jgi:uroporphyrinogen-III synthase